MNMPELWPHQLSQASGRRVSFHTPVLLVVGTVLQSFIQIKLKDPSMFVFLWKEDACVAFIDACILRTISCIQYIIEASSSAEPPGWRWREIDHRISYSFVCSHVQ